MASRWPYPRILGHRGGGTLAPENTLAGIRLAAQLGFEGVEFDVMLSADGTPILIHDETLERTTDGRGDVAAKRDEELFRLDAGSWYGESYRGERIPTLAAAAQLCRELNLWANVEIKPARGREEVTGSRVALGVREAWRGAPLLPVLSSFSPVALAAAREAAPEIPRGLLVTSIPADWRDRMDKLDCFALHCDHRRLAREVLERARREEIPVLCYTVNDEGEARRLLREGVAAIVTDSLDRIPASFR